jgi:diguanylate cyclase (GGDEF)-like protein
MINDTKGHLAGDEVLKKVSKILLEVFSEPEYRVFRIGGDEFSVISDHVFENEIIENLIVLKERLENSEGIRLSKGYSMVKDNPKKAFKYADEMLYADKLSKKDNNMRM